MNRVKLDFWISKIDAVGFIVLSLFLSVPVWAVSYMVEASQGFAVFIALVALVVAGILDSADSFEGICFQLSTSKQFRKSGGIYSLSQQKPITICTRFI
ncbi:hypothetical protein SG34_013755 [Thalassomonas viridans]|uniref:Uncharacterized protein n=1 Tax=Thalassomonas viridans TaxID=137584 RepID=A0AAE9Z791_9GAMM|nr:hypothetical protein [Thalassomonas viridans]WDE07848.1 hypothetical protein SG34_013755 [Thalassomonas viridans]